MFLQKVTFDRLFCFAPEGIGAITYTVFGFESGGKRHFDVKVAGTPRLEQGMTVIALTEEPGVFGGSGLVGWVDCHDGSIVCDSALKYFGWFVLCVVWAVIFPAKAYSVVSPTSAEMVAAALVALFGVFACQMLYVSVRAVLVKRALVSVRGLIGVVESEQRVGAGPK